MRHFLSLVVRNLRTKSAIPAVGVVILALGLVFGSVQVADAIRYLSDIGLLVSPSDIITGE
jgi:hypothetical protein